MAAIKTDTEGGFAAFIERQHGLQRDVRVTLAQFDTQYEVVYADRAMQEVPPLVLEPRGMTALYDGVGCLITDVGAELAAKPEGDRPGTVILVVLTDGHENSSHDWTHEAVREAITRQESEYSWTFVFLGAKMDAVDIGQQMGFPVDRSLTTAPRRTASARRSTPRARSWHVRCGVGRINGVADSPRRTGPPRCGKGS